MRRVKNLQLAHKDSPPQAGGSLFNHPFSISFLRDLLLSFITVVSFLSCAGQFPLSGGPVDLAPPKIIATYPENNATHFQDQRILLKFDEHVERSSVEGSIFISPYVGALEFDWSGKEVEIRFADRLRDNTTYVVNVGTDVVDLRNRNRMASAYALAFSTGPIIDKGVLEGRVFSEKSGSDLSGIMVFAYRLDTLNPDTLDPKKTRPDYITQTSKLGEFSLRHVSLGRYRVMGVRDEYKNLLYVPEVDEYGMQSSEIILTETDSLRKGINLMLSKEDTTAPRLLKANQINNRMLQLEFSEELLAETVLPQHFVLSDTATGEVKKIYSASLKYPRKNEIILTHDSLQQGPGYKVLVERITDAHHHTISEIARSLVFSSIARQDTGRIAVQTFSISDSLRDVPLEFECRIDFSRPVMRKMDDDFIVLSDSAGNPIPISIFWESDLSLTVRGERELMGMMWYTLNVRMDGLDDVQGVSARPGTQRISFQTIDRERMSSIDGSIEDVNASDPRGSIYIEAMSTSTKKEKPYRTTTNEFGRFVFPKILEGQYVLKAFKDRNGNEKHDVGNVFPYVQAERFAFYPDTLKVRARWPLEGVRLQLK